MIVRKAKRTDLEDIMVIVNESKRYFKEAGIDQWQKGYPNPEGLGEDIDREELYVLEDNGSIIGMTAGIKKDPYYDNIYEGEWLTKEKYLAMHRVAIKESRKGQGLGFKLFEKMEEVAREENLISLRIDTHRDNKPMIKLIKKNGFEYCGIIYQMDGDERVAYEKLLD